MFKAQHTIITLVVGDNFKTALTVHNFHSLGSIPCRAAYRGVTGKYIHNISFTSFRVPIYTPGWRAAMWIKCLAEGQKCQALTGIEPATLWSRVKGSLQYTTAPPQWGISKVISQVQSTVNICLEILFSSCICTLEWLLMTWFGRQYIKSCQKRLGPWLGQRTVFIFIELRVRALD